jgi:hypothetical protein
MTKRKPRKWREREFQRKLKIRMTKIDFVVDSKKRATDVRDISRRLESK